jgi:CRISPR-associated exonuclease Cas4
LAYVDGVLNPDDRIPDGVDHPVTPILAGILFLLAILLLWLGVRQRRSSGLPGGRIIYVDGHAWNTTEKPFFDPELNLAGKPDYLIQQGKTTIPVEVKSSRGGGMPYDSHIYQLGVYCLLVEKCLEKRPPYGILNYSDHSYAIDFTPAFEASIMDMLAEMHSLEKKTNIDRSHNQPSRCTHCGYRSTCDQRLA